MKEVIRKEILHDLGRALEILERRESRDIEELKQLSDHAIDKIAAYKDLELVSISVLFYSLYKTIQCIPASDYASILQRFRAANDSLQRQQFSSYNKAVRDLFEIIRRCSAKVKEHLHDVLHAARIKKGTLLLHHGLSIGQAAGLMGLSNWDLQVYAGKTPLIAEEHETIPARKRVAAALKLFGVAP